MSDSPDSQVDPDSPQPMGDVERFTRRRVGPAKFALAVLLAVLITVVSFAILSVVLSTIANVFH